MRYKPGQREETRQRMQKAASQAFRTHGFAGIGVDGIAKSAGVTSGAFYSHFGSKEGAFAAGLELGLDEVIEGIPRFQAEAGSAWVRAFVEYYLGAAHRADPACGCAMTTLSPEVVRAPEEIRALYQEKMKRIVSLAARGLAGGDKAARKARAWAMISTLVGGLTLARAMGEGKPTEQIAAAVIDNAIQAAGEVAGG